MGRLCMDLSTASGTPTAARDHPAPLTADDSVGAAPPDAAGRRSAGVAPVSTVAASVHALRASSAQVRDLQVHCLQCHSSLWCTKLF